MVVVLYDVLYAGRVAEGTFDGIPFCDLPVEVIVCDERAAAHLMRRSRKRSLSEVDLHCSWVVEAALDPVALIDDGRTRTVPTIRVTGWSPSARRLIAVVLAAEDHPPTGTWRVMTAWAASAEKEERP